MFVMHARVPVANAENMAALRRIFSNTAYQLAAGCTTLV